ncbi:hypothetical protein G5I_11312 [Acromyrmex echinatior]|uniref:Uncharacterized protein n=1 Tax=Acromyrmex echinatior TaxID=103372 RepID=F4WZ97_ACREC|nr:hypothetical protein G5I_11312 [Acromyrmex echinatior]
MRTNSRGCLSCQTGRAARARPPARIPLDFRGFQWVRVTGRSTTRRRREVPYDLDIAFIRVSERAVTVNSGLRWGKNARSQELSPRETCVFFAGAAHSRGATRSDIGERRATVELIKEEMMRSKMVLSTYANSQFFEENEEKAKTPERVNRAKRAPEFATWKRRRAKDVSLLQKNNTRKAISSVKRIFEDPPSIVRARILREGGTRGKENRGKREGKFERTERTKEEMSAVESALDVLSRAATMMQGVGINS